MNKIVDEKGDGRYFEDEDKKYTVYEDNRGEEPRYYAWKGGMDDQEKAARTPIADSLEGAVEYLRYRKFQCEKCGMTRGRIARTLWDDECPEGGRHHWKPFRKKRKVQDGIKINMWFSNAQLEEIEEIAAESGNDRASTIRELVALGIKARRQVGTE